MTDHSKFGNIHKIDSKIDEFDVIRTKYVANITFKSFEIPSVPLEFNLPAASPGSNNANRNIGKAMDIQLQIESLKFTFQLECDETFAGRGWNTYQLSMKVNSAVGADSNLKETLHYVECRVLTECPCLQPEASSGPYTLFEMSSSPVVIFSHKHNCFFQQLPGIITVKFNVIDVSRASFLPYEVLKLMAKRNCSEALKPVAVDWEKRPPNVDLAITYKGGRQLVAHKAIVKARVPVLRSLFETFPNLNELDNREFSSFVVNVILNYIYTGALQEDWMKDADAVIYAAKKYQLLELMELTENFLINSCTRNSASTNYNLAKKHSLKHATKGIQLFIKELMLE